MPMRVAEFMPLVERLTLARLPQDIARVSSSIRSVWLQMHYHTPKVHYEVWLTRKTGRIEIGLHFEGPREFSYRWAELMAPHMPAIQGRLGPLIELEEWTPSWTRIHQSLAYDPLTEALAEQIAGRLAQTIIVLQPIVETERGNVPPELEHAPAAGRPAAPGGRRRFGRGGKRTRRPTGM